MLKSLRIVNYALIEHLEISFEEGFSSITGETGAGKSIMLGALALLMGKRADTTVLKNTEKKSIVEAVFYITSHQIKHLFKTLDLDFDFETIIRREISPQGKSRAFINDTPVQIATLKTVSEILLDIHSQHQNLFLKESAFQMSVVDAYAKNQQLLQEYETLFLEWKKREEELEDFKIKAAQNQADYDYNLFCYNELEQAQLQKGEEEKLEQELETITCGEEIKKTLSEIEFAFENEENSILKNLQKFEQNLQKHTTFSQIAAITSRLSQINIELADIAYEISRYNTDFDFDINRLESIESRLSLLHTLQKKYSCTTVDDLLIKKDSLETFISHINNKEFDEENLKKSCKQAYNKAYGIAQKLSKRRIDAITHIEPFVLKTLQSLGMPSAAFTIEITTNNTLTPYGIDSIKMLFSANKHIPLQWLGDVASGGEIARIMLCLKTILAQGYNVQTIIFDEIDTGVSGEIADKMADVMDSIASHMQVITITHLPQIAAKSKKQFKVFKTETSETTITNIIELNQEQRIEEIAKMISGKNITHEAIAHAKLLLRIS